MTTTITDCVDRQAVIDTILASTDYTEDELRAIDRQFDTEWKYGVVHGLLAAIDVIRGIKSAATVIRYEPSSLPFDLRVPDQEG